VPTDYFKFNAVELFINTKDEKIVEAKSWFYNANLAGFQFIEDTIVNNGLTECKPNLVINSL
jgi:hypothetical protein